MLYFSLILFFIFIKCILALLTQTNSNIMVICWFFILNLQVAFGAIQFLSLCFYFYISLTLSLFLSVYILASNICKVKFATAFLLSVQILPLYKGWKHKWIIEYWWSNKISLLMAQLDSWVYYSIGGTNKETYTVCFYLKEQKYCLV